MFIHEMKCTNEEIVLIYSNINDLSKFSAGRIVRVFEEEILLAHYLPNGKYDGFIVISIKDIIKAEKDTLYSKKIKLLSQYHNTEHGIINTFDKDGFMTIIRYANENRMIVSVELLDSGRSDIIGFVNCLNEDSCQFDQIDDYGNLDGQAIVNYSDISFISCDGDEENTILVLNRLKMF